jgi:TrmH RNA methyltransferase
VKPKEITICGLAAVRAQFAADAAAIKRLYFDYATGRRVGAICKALAQAKKVYRCVEPAELVKVGGTIHHGGIVAVVSAPELRTATTAALAGWVRQREPLLVLDRVGNAHNLGAIARTAAFFGVPRLVLPEDPAAAMPGDAAYRVAEGGLAHLEILRVPALPTFLRDLAAAGYEVVGAVARGGKPQAVAGGKPIAIVLGNEEEGLAPDVTAACTRLVTIPGSGKVESLNVSVAAAILVWELVARSRGGDRSLPRRG